MNTRIPDTVAVLLAVGLLAGCAAETVVPAPLPTRTVAPRPAEPTPTQTPIPEPSPVTPTPTPTRAPAVLGEGPALVIGEVVFAAEIALTADQRQKGLSGRDSLGPLTGMLFPSATSIWMKGMRFPLDLVWITGDCTVDRIDARLPAPQADVSDAELPRRAAGSEAEHVFEINAGEAEKHGIVAGASVRFVGIEAETGGLCE